MVGLAVPRASAIRITTSSNNNTIIIILSTSPPVIGLPKGKPQNSLKQFICRDVELAIDFESNSGIQTIMSYKNCENYQTPQP